MMLNLYYFLFIFINFILFCKGCLRTPVVESSPSIVTGDMIIVTCPPNTCDTAMIMNIMNSAVIGPAIADANCIYRILVTCQPGFVTGLQVSGSGNGVFGPPFGPTEREISCLRPGSPTGGYTYIDRANVEGDVTSLRCF